MKRRRTPSPPSPPITRRGVAKNLIVVAIFLVFTLVVGVAFAYFGGTSTPGGNGASAATSVIKGSTPTVVAGDGAVTVSWTATTLASGGAVSGYVVKRYDSSTLTAQTVLSACNGVVTATTCTESGLPTGSWRYSVTPTYATNWLGTESDKSDTVTSTEKDVTPPVNAVTAAAGTGAVLKSGSTIYYRGVAAGSFTLTNALTDASSGPASSTTSALTGTSTGWTHTASTVSTPSGGPYVSNAFSWTAGTTSSPSEAVVGRDVKGNTATTNLSLVNDSTAPTAAVSYTNGYESGRSVSVTFSASDAGSGLASRQLQRAYATLSSGTCSTYTSFAKIGSLNPSSPYADTQVSEGYCYKYRYVANDALGNQTTATSTSVTKFDYQTAVAGTTGLLSQWHLGEKLVSSDTFTGTAGTLVSSRTGETGATWSKFVNDSSTAVLTDANRLRRNATGGVTYIASGTPASADYQVSLDVVVKSLVSGDYAGVVGRLVTSDTSGQGTRYYARYNADGTTWELLKVVSNTGTVLGTYNQNLTVGQSYRLTLDMTGSSIRLLVDSVARVSVTDTAITAAGSAGIRLGAGTTGAASTNTTGLHVDNFKVTPRAADSKGSNPGTYVNDPTLGATGAIAGDSDTAAVFDGVSDYVQMTGTTGIPTGAAVRSVEAWFKTASSARQVIFSYGTRSANQEFGLWIQSGGAAMVAWGFSSDKTFTMPSAVNDGAWHQVVETYDGSSLTLYIDGVALPSQAATRSTTMDSYGFGIGAVITPGDSSSGGYFNGMLDEVSFYTTALTQTTVSNHYALGTSPVPDTSGPTGGSVDATGLTGTGSRYSSSTTLSVALDPGTDPNGIADSGNTLLRATATLTSSGTADGTCGTFGSYALVSGGTDPDTPKADTVTDQACYSYRYVVLDSLGNSTTYTSPAIKVETTGPSAPALAYSALTNTAYGGSGSTLYYRSAATSGSFTVTATATDAQSGVTGYSFPSLGTNWTSAAGATGVNTYSWSGLPAAPGTSTVTATNNAGIASTGSPFTLTADDTPPSAGSVSYAASSTSTSVDVAFTTGTDTASGIGTRLLQRASATLTGSTCGTFGSYATVTGGTNPTSPLTDTVAAGNCYKYQYVVSDNVGNKATATATTVLKVTGSYADTVQGTSGLVGYWRLGEKAPQVDTFAGTTGATLSSRAGDSGITWTRYASTTLTGVITDQNRLRATGNGGVGYYTSDVPAAADYVVEADVYVKTLTATDDTGVVGRLDPSGTGTGTFYLARYDTAASQWQLIKNVNGTGTVLGTYAQTLTAGSTYGLALSMHGISVRLLVDDVPRVSVTDSALTATGRAGVALGQPGNTGTPSDSTGLQLDNFHVADALHDSKGTDDGDYLGGPALGVTGAVGDSSTAAKLDGVEDFGTVARPVADDLSIELWFKSTQGIGTGSQWYQGAGLVDADLSGTDNDFGIGLRSDGKVVAGTGTAGGSDVSIVSSSGGYNDGSWHQVVFTRVKATGALKLYVDGVAVASGTGGTTSLNAQANLTFGRIASGGNFFAGTLDEVAAYSSALSATVVAGHYTAAGY